MITETIDATGDDDLLAVAADFALQAAHYITTYDVDDRADEPLNSGLIKLV